MGRRGKGGEFLLGGLGGVSSVGVGGNAPIVPRALNSKEAANKGAGSEASLPVTKKPCNTVQSAWEATAEGVQRAIGKPSGSMAITSMVVRTSLSVRENHPIIAIRGISPLRRRVGGFAIAPDTPSQHTPMLLGFYRGFSLLCSCFFLFPLKTHVANFPKKVFVPLDKAENS